jgi:SPP1 gp7 family putative phage head morphogenesis protein
MPLDIKEPLDFDKALALAQALKIAIPASYKEEVPKDLRKMAFWVAGIEKVENVSSILDSLNRALSAGDSYESWRDNADLATLGISKGKAQTIYRNQMQVVFNSGVVDRSLESKDTFPYLMYDSVNDSRTRPNHAALDGTIKPVDSEFWTKNTPPIGHNCRCTVIPLTKDQAQARGGVTKNVSTKAKPDEGWDYDKTKPIKNLQNIAKRKLKVVPKNIKEAFDNKFKDYEKETDIWFERNRSKFTEQGDE